jgi:putative component of membrane protein insertase Oxa1/YidC/SpoIIIJ protein YidD
MSLASRILVAITGLMDGGVGKKCHIKDASCASYELRALCRKAYTNQGLLTSCRVKCGIMSTTGTADL